MSVFTTGGSNYPYMEAEAGELTVRDVERLLSLYKDVVTKYTTLCKAVRSFPPRKTEPSIRQLQGTDLLSTLPEGNNENTGERRGKCTANAFF